MSKIATRSLRDGDLVQLDGATIKIEGEPVKTDAPGRRVIFRWPNMSIVAGQLHWAPEATMYSIQADSARTWHVTRRGA